jgi:hypothetical protein
MWNEPGGNSTSPPGTSPAIFRRRYPRRIRGITIRLAKSRLWIGAKTATLLVFPLTNMMEEKTDDTSKIRWRHQQPRRQ